MVLKSNLRCDALPSVTSRSGENRKERHSPAFPVESAGAQKARKGGRYTGKSSASEKNVDETKTNGLGSENLSDIPSIGRPAFPGNAFARAQRSFGETRTSGQAG